MLQSLLKCASEKKDGIKKIGADQVVFRESNLTEEIGKNSVNVVIDLVAGSNWKQLPDILKPGGRYATSGAICWTYC